MSAAPQLHAVRVPPSVAIRPAASVRLGIGHALVDTCSLEQAQAAIINHAASDGESAHVITPNAQHIVLLHKDARLRQIYRKADLVVPDGVSLLLAARIFGRAFPERVPGVDLFQALCKLAAEASLSVFFLGGRPGSADLAATCLRKRHPELDVKTYCPPINFESNPAEINLIANLIKASRPRILFVAFGAPKQEYWIHDHGRKLGANVCMGVGGSFEMVSGVVHRAPMWIQSIGCEWLHRLCMEPRRMWRRYLIGNFEFLFLVLKQRIRRSILQILVNVLKSTSFEAELQDASLRAEAINIMLRFTAVGETAK